MKHLRSITLCATLGIFSSSTILHSTAHALATYDQAAGTPTAQLNVERDRYEPGKVLVKFKSKAASSIERAKQSRTMQALAKRGKHKIRKIAKVKARGYPGTTPREPAINRWHVVELPPNVSVDEAVALFRTDADVEAAEPNYTVSIDTTPNDPRYFELWGLNNTGQSSGTPDADIDADLAWDVGTGDGSVIVGVLDTGVDYTHEDLAQNMWVNPGEIAGNGLDDDNNGYVDDVYGYDFLNNDSDPMDDHGHGTHVSGTIAAVGNNGIGVVGVNWNAKIMALKFLSETGFGSIEGAVDALNYATNMGARITNNSWGDDSATAEQSAMLYDAVAAANEAGSLLVASAGNSSIELNVFFSHLPATIDLPNVVSVAASDKDDKLAGFSNWGATGVDLAAPGVSTLSTTPPDFCAMCSVTGYISASGTSMAAPHVAGAAALLLSRVPGLTAEQLKEWLMESVDTPPELQGTSVSNGRLNIANAMLDTDYKITASPSPIGIWQGESGTVTLSVTLFDSFNGPVALNTETSDPGITVSLSSNQIDGQPGDVVELDATVSVDASLHANRHSFTVNSVDPDGKQKATEAHIDVIGPDFALTVTPSPFTVDSGDTATYTVNVESIEGHTGPITLEVESPHGTITPILAANSLPLPADGSGEVELTVDTTIATPGGDHQLRVIGSDGEASREATMVLDVTEVIELQLTSATFPTQIGELGHFEVEFTAENIGNMDSGFFVWGVYLSGDANITEDDRVLAEGPFFPGLAPLTNDSVSKRILLPGDITSGQHYLGVIVDNGNDIDEPDESNNTASGAFNVVAFDADLTVTSVTAFPATLQGGDDLTVMADVTNLGSNDVDAVNVSFYLSTDDTINSSDTLLGSKTVDLGGTSSDTVSLTAPAAVTDGEYRVGVVVDGANAVAESNEGNNVGLGGLVEVTSAVDLVVSAISAPQQAEAGESFTVDFEITNQGGLNAGLLFWTMYLSNDNQFPESDELVEYGFIFSLNAGQSFAHSVPVSLPDDTPAGQHYLIVVADESDLVPENDESNNTDSDDIDVTSQP